MPSNLRRVTHYIWAYTSEGGSEQTLEIPKTDYWDGSLIKIDGRTYAAINSFYRGRDPDEERLECGHVKPMSTFGRKAYYNERRRCKLCAIEQSGGVLI